MFGSVFGGGSPSDRLAVEFPSGTPRWIGLVVTKRGALGEIYQESGKGSVKVWSQPSESPEALLLRFSNRDPDFSHR